MNVKVEKMNITVPPDLARWAREEAARRTIENKGTTCKVSHVVVEALGLLKFTTEVKGTK